MKANYVIKVLEDSLEPSLIALFRFFVASLVFVPYVIQKVNSNSFDLIKGGIVVGSLNAMGYFAQAIALETAGASNTAFICSLTVIVVPILGFFTFLTFDLISTLTFFRP